jgi:hypothetical protein
MDPQQTIINHAVDSEWPSHDLIKIKPNTRVGVGWQGQVGLPLSRL